MPLQILVQASFFEEHVGPDTSHPSGIIQRVAFLHLHLHDATENPKGGRGVPSSYMDSCVAKYLIFITLGFFTSYTITLRIQFILVYH